MILFSTGLDLLSVVHKGWALLGIATGVSGWLFRLVPLSWHCWEWLTFCWLRSLEFLWRGCHIQGLQGYRSLARLWAVEWLSASAEMSAEDSPIFCLHFVGSHICWFFYFCFEPCLALVMGSGISLTVLPISNGKSSLKVGSHTLPKHTPSWQGAQPLRWGVSPA